MARFISTTVPFLFINYRNLKYAVEPVRLARSEGVQFIDGRFETADEALAYALREYLKDFEMARSRPENKGVIINPPFYEDGEKVTLVDEQVALGEREKRIEKEASESKVQHEFYQFLRR